MFDLSSPNLNELPLSADVLRNYTPEFEIRVERAFMDLRECLREAVRDKDHCRELANTYIEDIEEMNNAHKSEIATLRAELHRRRPAPLGIEAECVQLRSQVTGLGDELADLT